MAETFEIKDVEEKLSILSELMELLGMKSRVSFRENYLIPAIAYTLVDDMEDHRKYMVIVIDDTDMSELASQLENELNVSRETVTRVDSLYYYQYYYYVYE